MILLYPFSDFKNSIRISSDYKRLPQGISVQATFFDPKKTIEDWRQAEKRITLEKDSWAQEGLWTSTCFEVFIKPESSNNYYELNLHSSGRWNLFEFSEYRKRLKSHSSVDISEFEFNSTEYDSRLKFNWNLESLGFKNQYRIFLSAVIKMSGDCHYYAPVHKVSKPDFHWPENFIFKIGV